MPRDIFTKRTIVVRGARNVGKTCLLLQHFQSRFVAPYYPTIHDEYIESISFNGIQYDCRIMDTAGQDEFSILNGKHAIGVHGFVLVYSVASMVSFNMVKIEHSKIVDFCGLRKVPTVIVGQKIDLARREVSFEQAQSLASELGCPYIEASALNNINVGKVFELCMAEIEKTYGRKGVSQPPGEECRLM